MHLQFLILRFPKLMWKLGKIQISPNTAYFNFEHVILHFPDREMAQYSKILLCNISSWVVHP